VLLVCMIHLTVSLHTRRIYLVRKGLLNLVRDGEFDVKNGETDTLAYKIRAHSDSYEKHYQIIAYRFKQVVGMLKYQGKRKKAEVTFEVFDDQTQQCKIGKLIRQSMSWWEYITNG
jgi:hypothetical protein